MTLQFMVVRQVLNAALRDAGPKKWQKTDGQIYPALSGGSENGKMIKV